MGIPMFVVFMACIGFSSPHIPGQPGNTVCHLYASGDCIANSYKNISPTGLFSVCIISIGQVISLDALQRWYLKVFIGQLEKEGSRCAE